jgi:membrane fusion protein (multidrug efflux system)
MQTRVCSVPGRLAGVFLACALVLAAGPDAAQPGPAGPPAVGVVEAVRRNVTESDEFIGRVQAIHRVELVARVSAFLQERLFEEGAEVKEGDLLYRLERAPYEAEVAVRQASVAQAEAELANARLALARARELRSTGAGTQVALDNATAQERSAAAQLLAAQAQVRQAQINLDYTEIRAPIDGRIGRTAVTIGNVVGPNSGVLATIVSQEPMYVTFPVPMRTALDLRTRYAGKGGFEAVAVKLRLPDGRMYGQTGQLGFVDIDVGQDTDTLMLRGTIPNPLLPSEEVGGMRLRELTNGEFVTVILEAVEPVQALTVPREAVLSDQRGDFVYVVGADNRVQRRGVRLGQSTPEMAVITDGLKEGEQVVLEGVQRVQPDMEVSPGPADVEAQAAAGAPAGGR